MIHHFFLISLLAGGLFSFDETPKADKEKSAPFSIEQSISLRPMTDLQFSPDGRRLAFTVIRAPKELPREQEIWMLNVQTKKAWRFAHSRKSSRNPTWSPDGSQLAFVSDREERTQIYVMPSDGGEAEVLTSGKNAVSSIAWSPKGDSIAFLAPDAKSEAEEKKEKDKDDARVVDKDDKPARLWVVGLTDKKTRKLSSDDWRIAEMKWALEGDRLLVVATKHPEPLVWRNRILSVSLADGATKEIATPSGPVSDLQVSLDGKLLSFRGARGDGPSPHDLFIVPAEGGTPRNLTEKQIDRPIGGQAWTSPEKILAVVDYGFASRLAFVGLDGTTEPGPEIEVNPFGRAVVSVLGDLAFVGQTAIEPHEIWLKPAGGSAERVTKINEQLLKASLVKPEFYRYTSFDKTEVEAALYRPKGAREGRQGASGRVDPWRTDGPLVRWVRLPGLVSASRGARLRGVLSEYQRFNRLWLVVHGQEPRRLGWRRLQRCDGGRRRPDRSWDRRPRSNRDCWLVVRRVHVRMGNHPDNAIQGLDRRSRDVRPGQRVRHRDASVRAVRPLVLWNALRKAGWFHQELADHAFEERQNANLDPAPRERSHRPHRAGPATPSWTQALWRRVRACDLPTRRARAPGRKAYARYQSTHVELVRDPFEVTRRARGGRVVASIVAS